MKQCSGSSLLHRAFELSVVSGVAGVGDMKVVDSLRGKSLDTENKTFSSQVFSSIVLGVGLDSGRLTLN